MLFAVPDIAKLYGYPSTAFYCSRTTSKLTVVKLSVRRGPYTDADQTI